MNVLFLIAVILFSLIGLFCNFFGLFCFGLYRWRKRLPEYSSAGRYFVLSGMMFWGMVLFFFEVW